MENSGKVSTPIVDKFLNTIEKVGNKLPDPAVLFLISLVIVWILSLIMAPIIFSEIDPRSGEAITVNNLLTGASLAEFLSNMVTTFTSFAPLGVVLVAMLGVGVAEHSGYINSGLKLLLTVTHKSLLTPMVIFVGILSHSAVDAGYVLVIPLGGIIFYAAGRHPLAGIAAAFAGVSGGFSANPFPSALDPLLQGFTQPAAQIIDPSVQVNPLCNWYFTAASSILIVGLGWLLTDRVIEPRLSKSPVDEDAEAPPQMDALTSREKKSFLTATGVAILGLLILVFVLIPESSPLRGPNGELSSFSAPIMRSIVPLIFLLFWIPGMVYGYMSGNFANSKDMIDTMTKAMEGMAYYVVMAFFCALFIDAFGKSNIGALMAFKGRCHFKNAGTPRSGYHCWNNIPNRLCQPFCRFCVRKMGIDCAHLCSHVDASGHIGRINPGSLSCGGLIVQYYYSVNAIFPISGRVLSALCQKYWNWYFDFYDATL